MTDSERRGVAVEMMVEAAAEDVDIADGYQITTVIPYEEQPPEVSTYTLPPQDLDKFFSAYAETGEIVVDIRPRSKVDGDDR